MGLLNSSDINSFGISSITQKNSESTAVQEETNVKLAITLSTKKITGALMAVALILTSLSVAGNALQYFYGRDQFVEFVRLFNLGSEQNIPTWYASATLLLCAMFLAYIAVTRKQRGLPYTVHWGALSAIFLFLSIDSVATIHDRTVERPLVELLHPRGFLHFPWVIPGAIFVVLLAVLYGRFLFHLPARTRLLFIIAAVLYIGGGLILEMVSAYLMDYYVDDILVRGFVATSQEFLEMVGLIIFIYALLTFIGLYVNNFQAEPEDQQPKLPQSNKGESS